MQTESRIQVYMRTNPDQTSKYTARVLTVRLKNEEDHNKTILIPEMFNNYQKDSF